MDLKWNFNKIESAVSLTTRLSCKIGDISIIKFCRVNKSCQKTTQLAGKGDPT